MKIINEAELREFFDSQLQKSVDHFVEKNGDPWAYAIDYVNQPIIGLQVKGPNNWKTDWVEEFRNQIMEFICLDKEEHKKDKERLIKEGSISAKEIVIFLAGMLAEKLAVSVASVISLVAIVVYILAKLGVKAYCEIYFCKQTG